MENSMQTPKKIKTQLLYDSATAILGTYLKVTKMPTGKGHMQPYVHCSIIQRPKRCKCPSMTEWKKKMWCVCVYIQWNTLFDHKREGKLAICKCG